jgi:hypothetical protein
MHAQVRTAQHRISKLVDPYFSDDMKNRRFRQQYYMFRRPHYQTKPCPRTNPISIVREAEKTHAIEPWVTSPSTRVLTARVSRRQSRAVKRGRMSALLILPADAVGQQHLMRVMVSLETSKTRGLEMGGVEGAGLTLRALLQELREELGPSCLRVRYCGFDITLMRWCAAGERLI